METERIRRWNAA